VKLDKEIDYRYRNLLLFIIGGMFSEVGFGASTSSQQNKPEPGNGNLFLFSVSKKGAGAGGVLFLFSKMCVISV
jgi:hypothetical protein